MKNDEFGNRMKDYEKRFTDIRVAPEEILCVRLDGKGFSKFTKGFKKPFDDRLTQSMVQTAEALVNETDAQVGYTQSDEITLIYTLTSNQQEHIYAGKISKINSILASMATAYFNKFIQQYAPDIYEVKKPAFFDCRTWGVNSLVEASNVLLWRVQDARKNSISAQMRWTCGHRSMKNMNGEEMKQFMLREKGVDWKQIPNKWKYGTFVYKTTLKSELDDETWNKIPVKNRPESKILIRNKVISDSPDYFGNLSLAERVKFIDPDWYKCDKTYQMVTQGSKTNFIETSKRIRIKQNVQDYFGSSSVEKAFNELLALVQELGWKSIDSAPKDGTVVDLLLDGERITNMVWGVPDKVWDCDNHCEFEYMGDGCWLHYPDTSIVDNIDMELEYTHWKHVS